MDIIIKYVFVIPRKKRDSRLKVPQKLTVNWILLKTGQNL